ncbi:MAG: DEAD/DEAH box helicase family protein [Gloeobacteraceae cyanobacterium ES-bin-316]|nr:DEAD/DEAH box helicase family protein [Ferruginibacter sp.]
MNILRYYQEDGTRECAEAFRDGHTQICRQLPTGGGKTVEFCHITNSYINKNQDSVLIVVDRIELLNQTKYKLYNEYNIIAFEIVSGVKYIPPSRVYIAMVESLSKRITQLLPPGLILLDECHMANFNKIIDRINKKLLIGFTATPISSNKKEPLNKRYTKLIQGPQISELISNKFLSQNITWAPRTGVDRSNLAMVGDDFDEVLMAKEYSNPKFVINTYDAYNRWSKGDKTIIYNVNISHSRLVYEEFLRHGLNVRQLDSTCSEEERLEILKWFKSNPDAILCNVGILTKGYDEPTVETIIVNKATNSLALWLQMTGRGGRIIDIELAEELNTFIKYSFKILDLGQNAITHGDWSDDRDWLSIFENPPKKSKNGVSPCKLCPSCEAILHASVMECKFCNFVFPPREVMIEELMSEYVVLTKNIDVEKIIESGNNNKQYFTFFKVIREHVYLFNKTKRKVTPEIFEFILKEINEDCKKWCHLNNKKFNKFHQNLCFMELQKTLRYEHRVLQ